MSRRRPSQRRAVTLHFTNNDNSAVNVYVVDNGTDHFLKQVAANSTEDLPVADVASGTQVRLKATRTDGSKTYTSDPMALNATTTWRVPDEPSQGCDKCLTFFSFTGLGPLPGPVSFVRRGPGRRRLVPAAGASPALDGPPSIRAA